MIVVVVNFNCIAFEDTAIIDTVESALFVRFVSGRLDRAFRSRAVVLLPFPRVRLLFLTTLQFSEALFRAGNGQLDHFVTGASEFADQGAASIVVVAIIMVVHGARFLVRISSVVVEVHFVDDHHECSIAV